MAQGRLSVPESDGVILATPLPEPGIHGLARGDISSTSDHILSRFQIAPLLQSELQRVCVPCNPSDVFGRQTTQAFRVASESSDHVLGFVRQAGPFDHPDGSMTRKIILFGAGGGGKNTLGALKRSVKVVAVSDNDTRKHGTLFCGIPVIAPGEIAAREYDLVLIASVYAPEIHAQLLALGVPRDKIEIADERRLVNSASFPWDALIFLALAGMLVAGLVGGLIAWMF